MIKNAIKVASLLMYMLDAIKVMQHNYVHQAPASSSVTI